MRSSNELGVGSVLVTDEEEKSEDERSAIRFNFALSVRIVYLHVTLVDVVGKDRRNSDLLGGGCRGDGEAGRRKKRKRRVAESVSASTIVLLRAKSLLRRSEEPFV